MSEENESDIENNQLEPFHKGELDFQTRVGSGSELVSMAKKAIHDYLPKVHQSFFSMLPMVFVAAEDKQQNIWASVLIGNPGFIKVDNKNSLTIHAKFIDIDPLANQLQSGNEMGLLGIQFETRRRNRVSAKISNISKSSISLEIKQCYGNCPKYIQRRHGQKLNPKDNEISTRFDTFNVNMQAFIDGVDSLFIASQHLDESKSKSNNSNNPINNRGVDSSHRGGMPGFVKMLNEKTLLIPDYLGNNFFNTMGNISLNPKTGIQFLDFENGHRVMLTGTSEIIWAEDQVLPFEGVDRMIKFTLDHGYYLKNSLPFTWDFKSYSPFSKAYAGENLE